MSKRFQKPEPRAAVNPPSKPLGRPRPKVGARGPLPITIEIDEQPDKVPFLDLDQEVQGRTPPIQTRQIIRALGQIHATIVDLATVLGVTEPTMHAIFRRQPEVRKLWDMSQTDGRISLRRKLVESNAPAVQMFLAKNYLGMRDHFDVSGNISHEHNVLVALYERIGKAGAGKIIDAEALPPPSAKTVDAQ